MQAAAATGEVILAPTTAILTAGASLSGKGLERCEAARSVAAHRAADAEKSAFDSWHQYQAKRKHAALASAEKKASQEVIPPGETPLVEVAGPQPA